VHRYFFSLAADLFSFISGLSFINMFSYSV
jgi:hypothetical protein